MILKSLRSAFTVAWPRIPLIIAAVLALGAVYGWRSHHRVNQWLRDDMLQQAQLIAQAVHWDRLDALSGTLADIENSEYVQLKEQLRAALAIIPQCRFLYLMGMDESGNLFFYVDSEAPGSEDESPPGQLYEEATEADHRAFEGVANVHGPITDRWGTWVSAMVPIYNPRTGNVSAVLGMDVDASEWRTLLRQALFVPILFTFALIVILVPGAVLFLWRQRISADKQQRWFARHTETLVATLLFLWLTLLFAEEMHLQEGRSREEAFARLAVARMDSTAKTIQGLRDSQLKGLARFFASSDDVSRSEFHAYAEHLSTDDTVHSWMWIPAVKAEDREALEESARHDGLADFLIWERNALGERRPALDRDMYYPALYMEPAAGNEAALGFDLGSEPIRRAAIEIAAKTGLVRATDPLILVHETENQQSIVVFYPVLSDTEKQQIRGFAAAILQEHRLFAQAIQWPDYQQPAIILDLHQLDAFEGPSFLATSSPEHGTREEHALFPDQYDFREPFLKTVPIFAFGHTYAVAAHPGPAFESLYPARAGFMTTLAGIIISVLLVTFVAFLNNRKAFLEQEVRRRTAALHTSETRLAATLRSIGDGVISTDADGNVTSLNAVAEQLTGWSTDEARGRPAADIFHIVNASTRQIAENPVPRVIREGHAVNLANDTLLLARDGTERQIADSCAPIRTDGDAITGAVLVFRDVTEEYRARREIQESTQRLEQILGLTRTGVNIIDKDFNLHYVDREWQKVYGDPTGRKCYEYFKGLSAPCEGCGAPLALKTKETLITEEVLPREDNRIVEVHSIPFQSLDGEWLVAEFNVDITARKQIEIALRESEERHRIFFEGSKDAMFVLDSVSQKFSSCNQAALALFGAADISELLGLRPGDLSPPYQPSGASTEEQGTMVIRTALREGSHYFEWTHRRLNGETFPCTVLLNALIIGGESFLQATVRDITERKRAEDALKESEARLNKLVAAAQDAIVMMDPNGNISMWNESAERIFGHSLQDAIGKNLHDLIAPKRFHEQHQKAYEQFRRTGTGNAVGRVVELIGLRKNGEMFPVELSLSSVNIKGEWHAIGILRDITERKGAETALQETLQNLEVAIRQANEMAEQAKIANVAKSQFLANMSHEIRTPMNGIIGAIGLLLDTDMDNEQRHYAEIVRTSGESLLHLIDDILDFSKIEAGKLDLEELDFDLRALLDDLAALFATRAHGKGIEFLCAAAPDVPAFLQGDPGRLRQVLTNLIGNALKFTHKGEVAVRVRLETETDTEALLRFAVRDTGIGIPENKTETLFEKFVQVDASTTRKYGGTGLGLAISKELVALMGGDIGVSSREDAGSEFWFTARFHKQPQPAPMDSIPIALQDVRILIADDNATNREILMTQCASWGMLPDQAQNGPAALRMLQEARDAGDPFTVLVVDMQMPEMDGETLGQAIKSDPGLADTRLVMMASTGQRGVPKRLEAIGFSAYLIKPVRQSDLFDCLAMTLGGAAQPRKAQTIVTRHAIREMRRSAVRILLAEDNVTNQQVALGMLQKLGLHADAVFNGREALQALSQRDYDVVIMDVQMPVMDGLEATRHIRSSLSKVRNHEVPIIAMTAHAMQGDRSMCLDAGMDDYISKPIDPKVLAETLDRFLFRNGPENPATDASPAEESANNINDAPLAQIPVFDRVGIMARLMDDEALVQTVIAAFLDDIPRQIALLKQYLAAGDIEAATRQVHTIKGAAANVGGEALRHAAIAMEKAGKNGDGAAMDTWLPELEQQFELLQQAMKPGDI